MGTQEEFINIKKEYDEFITSLLRSGRLPVKATAKGFWGTSVCDDILELFQKIGLRNYRNFIDLGSGDGRVALIASLFTNSTGIEVDQELHNKAVEIKKKLNLPATLINADYTSHHIGKYDIIYTFPDVPLHQNIEEKLLRELSPNGRVILYGPLIYPTRLTKESHFTVNGLDVNILRK
jgi:protein-L-isoaspartate O-methyltransferase